MYYIQIYYIVKNIVIDKVLGFANIKKLFSEVFIKKHIV